MEVVYKSDTRHRKQWFTGLSFSHPAKMVLPLQLWLIENFTKEGETILDPMAGSGTILVACSLGRHVVTVELENKFVEMQQGNWQKIRERGPQMGYQMGTATILQGDARNLEGLVLSRAEGILADKIISSPPYGNRLSDAEVDDNDPQRMSYRQSLGKVDKCILSPPYAETGMDIGIKEGTHNSQVVRKDGHRFTEYAQSEGQVGNLPYGQIDKIVTSPPYEASVSVPDSKPEARAERLKKAGYDPKDYQGSNGCNLQQDWSYHPVDSIMCSPPYEASVNAGEGGIDWAKAGRPDKALISPNKHHVGFGVGEFKYSENEENIGNLKSDSYLDAMLQVYQQCFNVLKPDGLLILVTKNFIRNKQEVRLDLDTIKLCEQSGFTFKERHYRKLTNQSFWRVIYSQKYPDAPVLDKEDILIFVKQAVLM